MLNFIMEYNFIISGVLTLIVCSFMINNKKGKAKKRDVFTQIKDVNNIIYNKYNQQIVKDAIATYKENKIPVNILSVYLRLLDQAKSYDDYDHYLNIIKHKKPLYYLIYSMRKYLFLCDKNGFDKLLVEAKDMSNKSKKLKNYYQYLLFVYYDYIVHNYEKSASALFEYLITQNKKVVGEHILTIFERCYALNQMSNVHILISKHKAFSDVINFNINQFDNNVLELKKYEIDYYDIVRSRIEILKDYCDCNCILYTNINQANNRNLVFPDSMLECYSDNKVEAKNKKIMLQFALCQLDCRKVGCFQFFLKVPDEYTENIINSQYYEVKIANDDDIIYNTTYKNAKPFNLIKAVTFPNVDSLENLNKTSQYAGISLEQLKSALDYRLPYFKINSKAEKIATINNLSYEKAVAHHGIEFYCSREDYEHFDMTLASVELKNTTIKILINSKDFDNDNFDNLLVLNTYQ